jgi:hypothetical protein
MSFSRTLLLYCHSLIDNTVILSHNLVEKTKLFLK